MKNKNNEWLCNKIKIIKGAIECEYTKCDEVSGWIFLRIVVRQLLEIQKNCRSRPPISNMNISLSNSDIGWPQPAEACSKPLVPDQGLRSAHSGESTESYLASCQWQGPGSLVLQKWIPTRWNVVKKSRVCVEDTQAGSEKESQALMAV